LALLQEIASVLFGHSEQQGVVIPDHPEYWTAYEARRLRLQAIEKARRSKWMNRAV